MNRKHLYILCSILIAIGGLGFLYKTSVLGFPVAPDQRAEIWRAEVQIKFQGQGEPVKVTLQIPRISEKYALLDQTFISPGYGLTTSPSEQNREAVFATRSETGEQVIYYRAVIQKTEAAAEKRLPNRPEVGKSGFEGTDLIAAKAVVDEMWRQSADEASFVSLLLANLRAPREQSELKSLMVAQSSAAQIARLAARLIRLAQIPARTVHGLPLEGLRRDATFVDWLEVFINGSWSPFQLKDGAQSAPENTVPWWRGNAPLVKVEGASKVSSKVATSRAYEIALHTALQRGRDMKSNLVEFSVMGLPIRMRAVYQILLAIPLGILVLVVLRNVVGMKTFGTFMPVLMAMAFRETDLLWGVLLFTVVSGIGLMVRFYLERLKLLLVPRLAAVVIVVIAIMAIISVVSHKLGFDRGLSVALFPIIILAMTIERMSIVWEERGPNEAFQQAAGSMVVAIICYLVMEQDIVRHLFFVFPELLLVILAITLLLGRYTGYRLVELPRFKILAGGK